MTRGPRLLALFLLGGVLLYAHTFRFPFVYDDLELLPHHREARDPAALGAIASGRYWDGVVPEDRLYRPLTIWTLAANRRANELMGRDPLEPAGFRVVNAALHGAVAGLLALLARALGAPSGAALFAGALFLVHPLHLEVVTAVVNRSESLAAGVGIGALLVARRGGGRAAWAGACLALAPAAKESGAAFAPAVAWMERTLGRRSRPGPLYGALGGGILLWALLRARAVAGVRQVTHAVDNPLVESGTTERILTAASVQGRYLALQLAPARQSSDYSFAQIAPVKTLFDPWLLLALAAAAVAGWGAWRLRRRVPLLAFCAGAYALLFLPASNLLFPIGTVMGERLAYAPSLAGCLAAGWGFEAARRRWGRRALAAALALLAVFTLLTVQRSMRWSGPDAFYRAQVESAPNSAKAHYSHAKRLQLAGDASGAAAHYRRAVEILPGYSDAWNNLGMIHLGCSEPDRAADCFGRAMAAHPEAALPVDNLGRALEMKGDVAGALAAYRRAIELDPARVDTMNRLAILLAGQGDLAGAESWWRRALSLQPGHAPSRENLALLEGALSAGEGRAAPR